MGISYYCTRLNPNYITIYIHIYSDTLGCSRPSQGFSWHLDYETPFRLPGGAFIGQDCMFGGVLQSHAKLIQVLEVNLFTENTDDDVGPPHPQRIWVGTV